MKILYVAMKYDYGDRTRGYSFEHYNFYDSLRRMGHDIVYFDFMTLLDERGRDGMNRLLLDVAKAERPDLMFSVLFTDELDPKIVRRVSRKTNAVTVNWFADDHWRFESFSKRWAPNFDWAVTTASDAVPKYATAGYRNAIKSQWACNHFLYRKLDLAPRYDVTFVGQPHGDRRATIEQLRAAGLDVRVWGHRWESGRLSQDEMIRVFNESRINLNLSNASRAGVAPVPASTRVAMSLEQHGAGRLLKKPVRPVVRALRRARNAARSRQRAADPPAIPEQIKGRNFEIPGCSGFLLSGYADDLERYYRPGAEIACFATAEELVEQVIHYLEHDDERERIAQAGYERTLREHTYVQRFGDIFREIGLAGETARASGDLLEVT